MSSRKQRKRMQPRLAALFIAWENEIAMPLTEDFWRSGDYYDPQDRGVGFLRWMMEDVMPSEIKFWPLEWVVKKFTCLSAAIMGGLISRQFFASNDNLLLGRYLMEMDRLLSENGIETKNSMEGLTDKGWATFNSIRKDRQFFCDEPVAKR